MIVCGDGQCDSPGHTAKDLCYFVMELVSGYILEVELRDKRHVGLISSNMEKQSVQISVQRLQKSLYIVEVVTDASSSIKKRIVKFFFELIFDMVEVSIKLCITQSILKILNSIGIGIFLSADSFTAVFHSLDVWHTAKSIRKCLTKVIKISYST